MKTEVNPSPMTRVPSEDLFVARQYETTCGERKRRVKSSVVQRSAGGSDVRVSVLLGAQQPLHTTTTARAFARRAPTHKTGGSYDS